MCWCFNPKHKAALQELEVLKNKLNPLVLEPVGDITVGQVAAIIAAKLHEMGDEQAYIFLADGVSRRYKKADVQKLCDVSETATIKYVSEDMDCDNFAWVMAGEFGKQRAFPGGVVDSHIHRLNWFIDEQGIFWFIEPQTRQMARKLEGWQGSDINFIAS